MGKRQRSGELAGQWGKQPSPQGDPRLMEQPCQEGPGRQGRLSTQIPIQAAPKRRAETQPGPGRSQAKGGDCPRLGAPVQRRRHRRAHRARSPTDRAHSLAPRRGPGPGFTALCPPRAPQLRGRDPGSLKTYSLMAEERIRLRWPRPAGEPGPRQGAASRAAGETAAGTGAPAP